MPRTRRSRHPFWFGRSSKFWANVATLTVVLAVLALGVALMVKAMNYGDEPPKSSVN
jgi:hypothetical protein